MTRQNIKRIIELLTSCYGEQRWQPDGRPVARLVLTILSQHTSDKNSDRAFSSLLAAFPDWESISNADPSEIAVAIKNGGLGDIKSRRIKQALNEIRRQREKIELDFLKKLSLEEARDWLKKLPGVGTKTANCVLLFSLGKPALPVDTHIFRVSQRLGLIAPDSSVEQAHQTLERLLPDKDIYRFHTLMIEHGRKVCKAGRPRQEECILQKLCPSYKKQQ